MLKHKADIWNFFSTTNYIYSHDIFQCVDLSLYKHAFVNQFIYLISIKN